MPPNLNLDKANPRITGGNLPPQLAAHGECTKFPFDWWFLEPIKSDDPERDLLQVEHEAALRACTRCPVAATCLAWALREEEYGVWGGLTAAERDAVGGKGASSRRRRTVPMKVSIAVYDRFGDRATDLLAVLDAYATEKTEAVAA